MIEKAASAMMSESMQMYLVTIARERRDDQPVPLSQLAQELSISPVSVNEMCRKLQEHGLVTYQPYKGVSLTPEGDRRAYYILRRHRLWEVFLVDTLGFDYGQAHEAACELEHTTPDMVADRLDAYLKFPVANPLGQLIPRCDGILPERSLIPLTDLVAGQSGHVVRCEVSDATRSFLDEQNIRPGASLTVTAVANDSILIRVKGADISLARTLGEEIYLELEEEPISAIGSIPLQTRLDEEENNMNVATESGVTQVPLHKLKVAQKGTVVHVAGKGAVKRRMMDMGLVPGSDVKVIRVAPLGDPIEFEVKGYSLSLRKSEASNITVEVQEGSA